ncbi:MAG: GntR family transcriptional regulator [Acidobacteria bacterium]|nr:GntR family transcriptional regulator [Acidobacteriota bacterium]
MATNDAGVSLVDRALHTTRERILDGTYAPGSRLRLHSIAEESGVSLIPAREVLRILERSGSS